MSWNLSQWCRERLLFPVARAERRGKQTRKRGFHPLIETLEDRVVPSAATINWNTVFQQIAGFGASTRDVGPMTQAQAQMFFSQTNGIGLSLIRSSIAPDPSGTTDAGQIANMQMAQALGATVWSTPWSPPPQWKTNGSTTNGGSLLTSDYQNYANELANYVLNMKAQGINIYAVSIQNEPDFTASYDSANWTGQQFHDFIAVLGPTFAQDGVTAKIMMPEESSWDFSLANPTLQDPNTAKYVSILAAHGYNYPNPPAPASNSAPLAGSLPVWETEVSTFDTFDPSINNGIYWAENINQYMTDAHANAWNFWWLQGQGGDNEGLVGQNGDWEATKRLYTVGNFSKFIRPGFFNIGETDDADGAIFSAYKDPNSGNFVIVGINPTSAPITETFNLNGFSATSVTPRETSATLNLAQKANIAVNGSTFTVTLDPQSVTSFVGTAGSISVPVAPTGLTATAGNSQVSLGWTAAAGAASYDIYRSTSSGGEGSTPIATGVTGTTFANTGLTNGTTYFYQVTSVNSAGQSGKSSEVSASPKLTIPAAPSGLLATPGNNLVALSWNAVAGATSYNIYRATTSGGEGSTPVATGVTGTSFTGSGLTNGTTYYFQVTAVNTAGESGKSSESSATPSTLILAIDAGGGAAGSYLADTDFSGGTPFANTDTINTAGVSNPAPQAIYDSERYGNSTYTVPNLTPGAAYTVRLDFAEIYWTAANQRLFNVSINGTQVLTNFDIFATAGGKDIAIAESFTATASSTGQVVIQLTTVKDNAKISGIEIFGAGTVAVPAPPTNVSASAGNGQVNLSWTAASGATSYNIYRSTTSGGEGSTPIATGVSGTTFLDTGVTNGTTYFYKVTAVNSSGESGKSSEASALALAPPTITSQPASLTVTAGQSATFSVTASGTGPLSYQWQLLVNGTWTNISGATAATFTISSTTSANAGSYWVVVSNAAGSVISSTATLTVNPVATVGLVTAIDAGGGAAGSFVADADFSGGTPYSTAAAISTSGVTNPAPQAVYQTERFGNFTYTVPNLTPGAVYTVRLDFAELFWTSAGQRVFNVSINGSQVLTNFDIFAAAGGQNIAIAESFTATASGTGQIAIQFTTIKDNAKVSGIEIFTTGSVTAPAAPTNLTAAASTGQVTLAWTASTGATSYNIYRSTTPGAEGTTPYRTGVTATSFADTGLSSGTTYYYKVAAVNAGGTSPLSTEASATPQVLLQTIAIDAGGGAVGSFVADTDFSGGTAFASTATVVTTGVSNPAPQSVYQTERYGNFTYAVPNLTAGAPYTVRLDFAEVWWNAAGQRLFNVTINGAQVLSNFDIFVAAGGQNIAIAEQFSTTANSSGQIVITFTTVKDNAKVSGIEIIAGAPELLAGTSFVNSPAPSLTQQQLDRVVARAIQLWTATGPSAAQVAALQHAQFVIAKLPDGMLGDTVGNVIYIDSSADGYGWSTGAAVAPHKVDLLTVVAHELGHELDLPDVATQTHPGDVMDDTLAIGTRRLPRSAEANIRWNW